MSARSADRSIMKRLYVVSSRRRRWCFIHSRERLGRMSAKHSSLAVLVMFVWGANFVVIDEGLDDVPPLLFLAMRFTFVALPLVFFVPRPRAGWRAVVAVGAFMSLG